MVSLCPLWFLYTFFYIYIISLNGNSDAAIHDRQKHIVYMGSLREGQALTSSYHTNMLQNVVKNSVLEQVMVRSYTRSFNAFAAYLTEEERDKLASLDEVVSIFPCRTLQLQTTGSWDFMGFPENVARKPTIESDVIVGVIDTGIWPESKSFSDEGLGPVPTKWLGKCIGGQNFTCNKKIIGARYYTDEDARDLVGHGTHTASTAAGSNVKNTSYFGIASGTARGAVSLARIAAYKACSLGGCSDETLLAAFDDAIADGVDIITTSIGGEIPQGLAQDTISIGSFHAMEKGILTLQSAGNSGDSLGSVSSVAPWLFSIAASTTTRRIVTKVVLGNGKTLIGNAVNSFVMNGTQFPLVYGIDASKKTCNEEETKGGLEGCLDSKLVKGKIVLCDTFDGFSQALASGAAGAVAKTGLTFDASYVVAFPATEINTEDFKLVVDYINSTKLPQAIILKSESIRDVDAPKVASFSSRGPNQPVPEIMKPDVTAPGVGILAAYSPKASPSDDPLDKRSVDFSILSGTSMSCPHVAGAAAYVKTFHPDWSPSAIKSALMTTAWRMNARNNPDAEFGYGAGHIDPLKAVTPGLVYETFTDDYIKMLCSIGYDDESVKRLIGANASCPTGQNFTAKDMNYPSMSFLVEKDPSFSVNFPRTVTNVGSANSIYKAKVTSTPDCNIKVEPDTLSFKSVNEKKSFVVTATGKMRSKQISISASLEWSDGKHLVRSPIVIYAFPAFES